MSGRQDLLVGDSSGSVTLFSNGDILARKKLFSSAVTSINIHRDHCNSFLHLPTHQIFCITKKKGNNLSIIAGDRLGILVSLDSGLEVVWRKEREICESTSREDPSIRCLLSVTMKDKFEALSKYVFVCSGSKGIHLLAEDSLFSLPHSSGRKVNSLCIKRSSCKVDNESQIVLAACEDGCVYQVDHFSFSRFFSVSLPLTVIASIPNQKREGSLVVVGGHFDEIKVYEENQQVEAKKTNDWVHVLISADTNGDGKEEIIVGCLDNSVTVFKFK